MHLWKSAISRSLMILLLPTVGSHRNHFRSGTRSDPLQSDVFTVARSGMRLLIFDDVEHEFAIGVPDEEGVLRNWNLYGDLIDALGAFWVQTLDSAS